MIVTRFLHWRFLICRLYVGKHHAACMLVSLTYRLTVDWWFWCFEWLVVTRLFTSSCLSGKLTESHRLSIGLLVDGRLSISCCWWWVRGRDQLTVGYLFLGADGNSNACRQSIGLSIDSRLLVDAKVELRTGSPLTGLALSCRSILCLGLTVGEID